MSYGMFCVLATICGLCFLFGVVYPAFALLCYPVYRLLGGRDSLREYIRNL